MRTTITLEYRSPYAAINSIWAAARQHGHVPDRIHLLTSDAESEAARVHARMLGALQKGLGVVPRVDVELIDINEVGKARRTVQALLKARKREGGTVAVDVTAGRTIPKLALFDACATERPHHVFYLDVARYDYRDRTYPLIPRRIQRSRDLLAEGLRDE